VKILTSFNGLWHSLPVIIRAVLTGLLVTSAGTVPWAILAGLNLKYVPEVPWAALITAPYLWFYWKYVRGSGWPRSTSEDRRQNCRAFNLSDEVWAAAIGAGILGLFALLLFQNVYVRMVIMPAQSGDDLSKVPMLTLFVSLIMSALVAGISEESGLRGYMQRPLEQRYGPVAAILITGMVFGFMHFTHREVTIALMPWYMGVAAVYGAVAYLSGSILPCIVLHAGGNILGTFQLLMTGRPEWVASVPQPLIWETGPDTSFWFSVLGLAAISAAAVWAFSGLARVAKMSKPIHP